MYVFGHAVIVWIFNICIIEQLQGRRGGESGWRHSPFIIIPSQKLFLDIQFLSCAVNNMMYNTWCCLQLNIVIVCLEKLSYNGGNAREGGGRERAELLLLPYNISKLRIINTFLNFKWIQFIQILKITMSNLDPVLFMPWDWWICPCLYNIAVFIICQCMVVVYGAVREARGVRSGYAHGPWC